MTDRKARLAALAAKAGRNNNNNNNNNSGAEEDRNEAVAAAGLKFRNYTPVLLPNILGADDEDRRAVAPPPKKPKTNQNDGKKDGELSVLEKALEKARKDAAAASSSSSEGPHSASATTTIETKKKINWDLKRDIQPKLDRLEKRTQKAIVALLTERLENEAAAAAPSSASALD
jgi:coiled-coil domain-containing protein 12